MSPEEQRTVIEWLKELKQDVRDTRSHLDAKVESVRDEVETLRRDLNGRVRKLENDRGKLLGALAVVSALASAVWTGLLKWLGAGG